MGKHSELIVYATPSGPLAEQIDEYRARSEAACGRNAAHGYPPHCTLTGFFHDVRESVSIYIDALVESMAGAPRAPAHVVTIVEMNRSGDWHGLELRTPWLEKVTESFAGRAHSSTRTGGIRLKSWLHLSLAYEFPPADADQLARLARTLVDPEAPVRWNLDLWERRGPVWERHWSGDLRTSI